METSWVDWLQDDSSVSMMVLHCLLNSSLQATLLLAGAAGAVWLLRRASSAWRHLIWLLALGGVLALPLISTILPGRFLLLSATPVSQVQPVSVRQELTLVEDHLAAPLTSQHFVEPKPHVSHNLSLKWFSGTWRWCVLGVWLSGLLLIVIRRGIGLHVLRQLERKSTRLASGPLMMQCQAAQQSLQVKRQVIFLLAQEDAGVVVPLTWGWSHPVVMLPSNATTWTAERQRAVLLHELAHVRRGDWVAQWVAAAACAVFWFDPLVWLAARALRAESERATDDQVLGAGVRPVDYGECLLEFVRLLNATQRSVIMKQAIAIARPPLLEERLRALVDPHRNRRGISRLDLLVLSALTVTAVSGLATVRAIDSATPITPYHGVMGGHVIEGAGMNGSVIRDGERTLPNGMKEFWVSNKLFGRQEPEPSPEEKALSLSRAKYLRQKWQPWALEHQKLLTQMLQNKSGDQAAFQQVWKTIPSLPQQSGISHNDLTPNSVEPPSPVGFTWAPIVKSVTSYSRIKPAVAQVVKQGERQTTQKRQHEFGQQRDIVLSTSMTQGWHVALWASGRITEQSRISLKQRYLLMQSLVGQKRRIKESDLWTAHHEVVPRYDFLLRQDEQ